MGDPDRMETLMLHTAGLSSRDAKWLADTLARNAARFGGWSMELDDDGDKGGDDKPADDKKPEDKPSGKPEDKGGDKPLGENGEKALKAEREERKKLEAELADLKKGLAAIAGVKDDDKNNDGDTLAQIQQQIVEMQREKDILALANKHRITDEDDLALLAATSDEEARKKLAERLAPAEEERDAKSRRPKPDRSQAGGGSDGTSGGKSVAQVMADRRAARAEKAASNT